MDSSKNKIIQWLVPALILILIPVFLGDYFLTILILISLYTYMAGSWNIIGGMGGQLSLGHGAFFGLGGYTSTVLFQHFGISPWIGIWVGVIVVVLFASFEGLLCFRYKVRGVYFALVTLAFGEVLRIIAVSTKALGGSEGIVMHLKGHSWTAFQFGSKVHYYIIISAMAIILCVLIQRWRPSQFISYLMAIREDEDVAQALGINVFKIKFLALVLSAALTALAGTFYAQYTLYIDPPSMLGMMCSIDPVIVCIIGGMGTAWGPLTGSIIFVGFMEIANSVFKGGFGGHLVLYGLLLMAVIIIFPRGLTGLFARYTSEKY